MSSFALALLAALVWIFLGMGTRDLVEEAVEESFSGLTGAFITCVWPIVLLISAYIHWSERRGLRASGDE